MLIKKKPADNTKLTFPPMGAKPKGFTKTPPDVENAADAKKPGDAKEDAADQKKPKAKKGASFFANKAAQAFVKK